MKTPKSTPTSLLRRISKAKSLTLLAALALPATTSFAQSTWISSATADFNNAANWNGAYIDVDTANPNPNCTDDQGSNNIVLIQAGDPIWYHGDTLAGNGANTSGAYLQTGGTNNTGYPNNGNWLRLGIGSGSAGYYVLSNGVVNVAGQTHMGELGYGYLEVDGGVLNAGVSGQNPGIAVGDGDQFNAGSAGSGTLVLNNGVINNLNQETWFGENGGNGPGTGYFLMTGGAFNAGNWFVFGRNGATGYGTMTGGTITFTGGGNFLIGGGGVGSLAQSGGTINAFNSYLVPQSNGSGSGLGTNILSGTAILNVHSWLAVGRGGYGEMDISGNASVTHNDGGSHFDIGAGGASYTGAGVLNQNGGTVTEDTSDFWLGEVYNATYNMNLGSAFLKNVVMSVNNGVTSTLNLNGGLFQATGIDSSSSLSISTLNLNGGTLQANANNSLFITGLYQAFIGSGGAVIDSQGYNINIPQALQDNNGGAATVTKLGSGTLILSGANTFGGAMTVNGGVLEVSTASSGGGAVSAANGAGFGALVSSANGQLPVASLALGGAAGGSLSFDLGGFGDPTTAPLNVIGALTANGTITVNVAASLISVGTIPLLQYGSIAGTHSFVVGALPAGVQANLATSGNTLELVVTSAGLPRWNGNVTADWDLGTNLDWYDIATMVPTTYSNGKPVVFDDNATGTTTVDLTATVSPASINFNNTALPYTIVGTGKITGSTGLNVNSNGTVAILNTGGNNFTGPVTIVNGSSLSVTNLANGGAPSALGASTANPTNLVLNDATLSYSGAPVAINRSFTIAGTNSIIDAEDNLTISGNATAVPNVIQGGTGFVKTGPALLDFNGSGDNEFSQNNDLAGLNVIAGTVEFDGSVGNQTNHTQNQLFVGSTVNSGAALILTNASLNVDSWIGLGRINGGINNTSSITLYNSALQCGNLSLGWDGGLPNNLSSQFLTLNGNSSLTNYGVNNLPEGANSSATVSLNDNSVFWTQNPFYICLANNTTGTVVVANSAKLIQVNAYFDVGNGNNCVASLLVKNNASVSAVGDFNVSDTAAGATASLTVQDNATLQAGDLYTGKAQNTTTPVTIAGSASANFNNFIDLANNVGSVGNVTIAGGSLTTEGDMTIGDQGTSVVNMVANGGGVLTAHGTIYLSRNSQVADGTVNLNAGTTIVAGYINNGWAFHNGSTSPSYNPNAFNFNGGTLQAYVGSPYFIQPNVNAVVQAGGAIINDGGYTIDVLAGLVTGGGNGGLTKVGSGTLHLDGVNTYTGTTLVSAGALGVGPGGVITGPVVVASGATLDGDIGAIGAPASFDNTLTLSNGSSTFMQINSSTPTNDVITGLTSVSYGGALVVTNVGGGALVEGTQYKLFSAAGAGTGHFSSITILSSTGSYSGTFSPATGILTIGTATGPTLNSPTVSAGNLILTGSGGTPNGTYSVLTSTNITLPLNLWVTNTTGVFTTNGMFSSAIPITKTIRAQFFDVKTP